MGYSGTILFPGHHTGRIRDIRYPKELFENRPIGRRRPGQVSKNLADGYIREGGTGHLLALIALTL
jgi:hypothetical protein